MRIVDNVTAILQAMKDDTTCALRTYTYQSPSRANVELDFSDTPTAVLYCVGETYWKRVMNVLKERVAINLIFATKTELDYDGFANEALIDSMRELALDFLDRMRYEPIMIVEDDIKIVNFYDEFDTNTTGVSLQCTIQERQGTCSWT